MHKVQKSVDDSSDSDEDGNEVSQVVDNASEEKVEASMWDLYEFMPGHAWITWTIGAIAAAVTGSMMPIFILKLGAAFDTMVKQDVEAFRQVILIQVYLGLGAGVGIGLACMCNYITTAYLVKSISDSFIEAVVSLEQSFFDLNESGSLYAKYTGAMKDIKQGQRGWPMIFMISVLFVASYAVGFITDWRISLAMCGTVPFLAAAGMIFMNSMASMASSEQKLYESASKIAEESFQAIRTVISLGIQGQMSEIYNERVRKVVTNGKKEQFKKAFSLSLAVAMILMSYGVGLWVGSIFVAQSMEKTCCVFDQLTPSLRDAVAGCVVGGSWLDVDPCIGLSDLFQFVGDFDQVDDIAACTNDGCTSGGDVFVVLMSILMGGMASGQLGQAIGTLVAGFTGAKALKDIIKRPKPLALKNSKGSTDTRMAADVTFEGVSFRYPSRFEHNIFSGLNLTLKGGQSNALVGPSGCGKSTITQLLLRLYEKQEGAIKIGDTDITDIDLEYVRDRISVVQQEPRLFALSIMENIRMGRLGATDEECIGAAMQANAHSFIVEIPTGYATYCGMGGTHLSGGQKQRICIARALINKPDILVLDEATSALDNVSEKVVQRTLDRIIAEHSCTTVIIAHRLSTIRNADNIIVLKRKDNETGAKVVEEGDHGSLMAVDSLYRALVESQDADLVKLDNTDEVEVEELCEAEVEATAKEYRAHGKKLEGELVDKAKKNTRQEKRAIKKRDKQSFKGKWKRMYHDMISGRPFVQKNYIIGCVVAIFNGWCFVFTGVLLAFFIEKLYLFNPDEIYDGAVLFGSLYFALGFYSLVVATGQDYFLSRAESMALAEARKHTFTEIIHKDVSYFDSEDVTPGHFQAILNSSAPLMAQAVVKNVGVIIQNVSAILLALIAGFIADWRIACAGIVTLIAVSIGGTLEMQQYTPLEADSGGPGASSFVFDEVIQNYKTVTLFNLQVYWHQRFVKITEHELGKDKKRGMKSGFLFSWSQFLQFWGQAFTFWVGSLIMENDPKGLDIKTFNIALQALMMAGMGVGFSMPNMADVGMVRSKGLELYGVVDEPAFIDPRDKGGDHTELDCDIVLNSVMFSYPCRPKVPVFNGIQFTVKNNEFTAFVGHSGCGKSTAMQLIQRLYDVCLPQVTVSSEKSSNKQYMDSGQVTVDGKNITDINIESLRSAIGLVSQEPVLFDLSIKDNVRISKPGASDEEVIEACKDANAHEFIMEFPNGYDTVVGTGGTGLSGGQKQRVAIARALIKKPKLLLLDEATSALDYDSERQVQASINSLVEQKKGKLTVVMIAHRLSTIRNADKIVVFKPFPGYGAEVVEMGTHDELAIKDGGVYRELLEASQ